MNIKIDIDKIKTEVIQNVEKQLTEKLLTLAESTVQSDYTLGVMIRDYTNSWISQNLKDIVIKQLESVDIKQKVDQAVERKVMDIVHQQLKAIKL